MMGFAIGGVIVGRLADRRGIAVPLLIGSLSLGGGFVLAALAGSYLQFMIAQFLLLADVNPKEAFVTFDDPVLAEDEPTK